MSRSPSKPWTPGVHPTYTAYRLRVNICEDEFGNVWSDHEFETEGDAQVAQALSNGSIFQIAHALLSEAVRREAFTSAMVELSKDPAVLDRYQALEGKEKATFETNLANAITHVITQTLGKMAPGAAREVMAMMSTQVEGSPTPSEG